MGFWVNPVLNFIIFDKNFFNNDTLSISSVVFLAIAIASYTTTSLNSNNVISKQHIEPLQIEFNRYPKLIIAIFILLVFFFTIFNLKYAIYQRGVESIGRFHSSIILVFTLLINYGFLFYSVKISSLILSNKIINIRYYFIPVVIEQFLTCLSMLSRVMPINTLLILFRFESIVKLKRLLIAYSILIIISSLVLISIVQTNRRTYHESHSISIFQSNAKYFDFMSGFEIVSRFIGIDGVYYTKEFLKNNLDPDLFIKMTFEKRIKGVEPIYHEIMGIKANNSEKTNFVHIPGIIGYLSAGFN